MEEHRTDTLDADQARTSDVAPLPSESPAASGMEVDLGDFTRTLGLMKSLRLIIDNQIVVPVEEIATGVGEAGRKFRMGDIEQANQDVARLYSTFGQKTGQWENQARALEQQTKLAAAKNPKSISIDKLNRMKAEQTAVRSRIRIAEVQFRRLHQGLDQAYTMLERQSGKAASVATLVLPSGFLAAFKAASAENRPSIVKEHFEIEAVLKVTVSKGAEGYDVKFDPTPSLDRLYYLTQPAQVNLLKQLGDEVVIQDVETGQRGQMRLVDFVKHVQSGVWLLQTPQSAADAG
jgi:hypothetical protein